MAKTDQTKLFVIKKYVRARSAAEALRKEKGIPADDVWVDEKWRESESDKLAATLGFTSKPSAV